MEGRIQQRPLSAMSAFSVLPPPQARYFFEVARSSLVLGAMVVTSSGCIVLGDPQYREPEQTAPRVTPLTRPEELIKATAEDDGSWLVNFRVAIESEDAGEEVRLVLLRNFGGGTAEGLPYEAAVQNGTLEPGTLGDGKRTVTLPWFDTGATGQDYDCAAITLLATHAFREGIGSDYWCPADPDDADTVTWLVLRCRADDEACSFDLCTDTKAKNPNFCDPPTEEPN